MVVCTEAFVHFAPMSDQPPSTATAIVEAELRSSSASLQVLQMHLPQTFVSVLRDERSFRFDLSLTPRLRSGLCFSEPGVWIIYGKEPHVTFRPVRIAKLREETAVIAAGLRRGERFVSLGAHLLHEGEPVRIDAGSTPTMASDAAV